MSIDKKIFNEKLYFRENALPKINSFENIDHQAKLTEKQIYREYLPWLRFNKPNLPERVKEQINHKQYSMERSNISASTPNSTDHVQENRQQNHKLYFPKLSDENENIKIIEMSDNINEEDYKKVEKENQQNSDNKNMKNKISYGSMSQSKSLDSYQDYGFKNIKKSLNTKSKEVYETDFKKVKKEKNHLELQKCDVSTETEQTTFVSIEVQTIDAKTQKVNKLDQALKISSTIENNYSLIPRRYKNIQVSKPNQNGNEHKEEIITTRIIDSFLPSISNNETENEIKPNKSYSYMNNQKKNNLKTGESSELKHAVLHAGMDFLDKYWASQRWLRLNKQVDEPDLKTEIPFAVRMNSLKKVDQKKKFSFRELFNERIKYYTDNVEHNVYMPNPQIDKINSEHLESIART